MRGLRPAGEPGAAEPRPRRLATGQARQPAVAGHGSTARNGSSCSISTSGFVRARPRSARAISIGRWKCSREWHRAAPGRVLARACVQAMACFVGLPNCVHSTVARSPTLRARRVKSGCAMARIPKAVPLPRRLFSTGKAAWARSWPTTTVHSRAVAARSQALGHSTWFAATAIRRSISWTRGGRRAHRYGAYRARRDLQDWPHQRATAPSSRTQSGVSARYWSRMAAEPTLKSRRADGA